MLALTVKDHEGDWGLARWIVLRMQRCEKLVQETGVNEEKMLRWNFKGFSALVLATFPLWREATLAYACVCLF